MQEAGVAHVCPTSALGFQWIVQGTSLQTAGSSKLTQPCVSGWDTEDMGDLPGAPQDEAGLMRKFET